MESFEKPLAMLIAAVLIAVAAYFASRQRQTLRTLHFNLNMPSEQRRYLLKQVGRRLFGSLLMMVLAGLFVGSLFLDYGPIPPAGQPVANPDPAEQPWRFSLLYWVTTLLVLMVVLALGVLDLWANARFAFEQQKRLAQEHQETLKADLVRLRQRRSEMN